jgi:hypothetical protein
VITHTALALSGSTPHGPLLGSIIQLKEILVSFGTGPFQVIVRVTGS